MDYDNIFKIIIVGDSGSGKSNILLRYSDNCYCENYITTIGVDFKIKTIKFHDLLIKLQIWDTAGQERFASIVRNYFRDADGIFIVYDITNRQSFDHVSKWMNMINENSKSNAISYLIGNKSDLIEAREVSESEGKDLASSLGIRFHETSAKDNVNLDLIFNDMTEAIFNRKDLVRKGENNSHDVIYKPTKRIQKSNLCYCNI